MFVLRIDISNRERQLIERRVPKSSLVVSSVILQLVSNRFQSFQSSLVQRSSTECGTVEVVVILYISQELTRQSHVAQFPRSRQGIGVAIHGLRKPFCFQFHAQSV